MKQDKRSDSRVSKKDSIEASRRAVAFRDCLNKRETAELSALTEACNAADGTRYSVPEDGDLFFLLYNPAFPGQLLAALVVFHMGDAYEGLPVDELAAFTAPAHRRQGALRQLLQAAAPLLREAVRFAVYHSPATEATLKALDARHTSDECMMRLRLSGENAPLAMRNAANAGSCEKQIALDSAEIRQEGERAFWKYGECMLRRFDKAVYCYGVLTYERFQRQGFGLRFLAALFARLADEGACEVLLEVSSENLAAVGLYEKLGFQTVERIQYYYLPIPSNLAPPPKL